MIALNVVAIGLQRKPRIYNLETNNRKTKVMAEIQLEWFGHVKDLEIVNVFLYLGSLLGNKKIKSRIAL